MYKKKTKQKLFMNFMTLMTLSHTGISINFMFETTMIYVCVKKLSRFLGIEYRYFNFCYYDWPLCILLCFFLFFVSCDFYFTLLSVYFYWNWANAWIPFLSFSFGYSYKNKYYFLDVVALFAMNQNLFVVIPWHRCNYILILRKQIGAKQNNIKTNCRTHQTDESMTSLSQSHSFVSFSSMNNWLNSNLWIFQPHDQHFHLHMQVGYVAYLHTFIYSFHLKDFSNLKFTKKNSPIYICHRKNSNKR